MKRHVPRLALSIPETAEAVGVTKTTIYRWIKLGLPTVRVGAVQRIEPDALLAWMRAESDRGLDISL